MSPLISAGPGVGDAAAAAGVAGTHDAAGAAGTDDAAALFLELLFVRL